jgi:hypothetical protein
MPIENPTSHRPLHQSHCKIWNMEAGENTSKVVETKL